MKNKLFNLWERIRTNFWFVPSLMVFLTVVMSFVMVTLDKSIEPESLSAFGFLYGGGVEGARIILSTIAGSMITVAGVTFSITMVALTLTSSQFGPRLLRNFMQDTGNQIVLGTFIATYIYCLLVLQSIYSIDGGFFVPGISVTFAIILSIINVGVLIYFIHHVSTSIHADKVVEGVYNELSGHIKRLFPEELGYGLVENEKKQDLLEATINRYTHTYDINASSGGYLQSIDIDSLLKITEEQDFCICLLFRPGEYIVEGVTLALLKSDKLVDTDFTEQIKSYFIVGSQRSPEQDVEFSIHQLVEVALRALSPGINDPFTAITCIDRLSSALCYLTDRASPLSYLYSAEGNLRVIAKPATFEGVVNAAFDQIRQDGSTNVAVTIRLLESLKTIAGRVRNSEQRHAILRQADMIARTSQDTIKDKNDKEDIQQRYHEVHIVLNEKA